MKTNFFNMRNQTGRVLAALFLLLTGLALTGCNGSDITASPNPLNFGVVSFGQSADVTLNVTFAGAIIGTYIAVDSGANTGDFQVVSQTCVGYGGTQSAVIRFKPTAAGTRSATLTIKGTLSNLTYTRTVALSGSTTPISAGLAGAALQFDGTASRVTIPHNAALNAFPLTVEAWINTTQTTGVAALVNKYAPGSSNGWQMVLSNGKLSGSYFGDSANFVDDGGSGAFSSGVIADGKWHHAAFTVDASGGKLYVDGALASSLIWTGTPTAATTTQPLTLGASAGAAANFAGQMDEARVWKVARSRYDLLTDRHASLQGNETGLIAYYRLDEGAGTTTQDTSASHFDGAVNGAVRGASTAPIDTVYVIGGKPRPFVLSGFDPSGYPLSYQIATNPTQGTLSGTAPNLTYTPGTNFTGNDSLTYTVSATDGISAPTTVKIVARSATPPLPTASLAGATLQFDGVSSSVVIPPNNALNTYPLTVEAWINTMQTTGAGGLVTKYLSLNGWQMSLYNGNLVAHYFRDSSNYIWDGDTRTFNGGAVADGKWHHVAFTVDVSGGKLYVDGTLKNSRAWNGTPGPSTLSQNVMLGVFPGNGAPFAGQMDEVRIWSKSRPQADIQRDMNASLQGNETGLLAYYRLDEGKGITAADATASHFDGALSGAQWLASTAPVDTINVLAGQPRSFALSGFDWAELPLSYQTGSSPTQGTLSGTAPSLAYTPGAGFIGNDALTYRVSAPDGVSSPATVKIVTRDPSLLPPVASLAGAALQFNGATSSVTVPNQPALDAYPLTVEAWINTTQSNGNAALVSKYADGSFNGWQMFLHNGLLTAACFRDANNYIWDGGAYTFNGGNIADGNWHHVAFTVNVSGGSLYVDGMLKNTLAWNGIPGASTTSQNLSLSAFSGGGGYFSGQMDEVRVWNVARTAFQLYSNRKATQRENENGLITYYRFDEGKGAATADATAKPFQRNPDRKRSLAGLCRPR